MFIQEIVVDGFKSYASRTVIGHFDPEFNAITGLNGSGKSNILDAICFVLGISNLSQVRASNLSELVYKQGQGGVTKATVSIVFNNADTKASPIGYEHCETITVSRTVVIGGRNKYLINGHTVQATAVQNLFHSVQLNVNNPHFLIMQGRITKVLNMKPPEILSMVEEAAGTRMFETKKQGALKTIEKKQTKVEEIDRILATEITPTLEKLRSERKAYLEWSKINTDCERLARFCVAHEYTKAGEVVAAALEGRKAVEAGVRASRVRLEELAHLIAAKGREIAERDAALAAASGGVYKRLAAEHDVASKEQAKLAAALENQRKTVKSEEKAHAAALAALTEAQATVVALQRSVNDADASVSKAAAAAETSSAAVAALTTSHNAAIAGLNVDTTGASTGTLADQLVAAKARVVELSSQVASAELQVTHSRAMLKDADKAARAASKELDSMKRAMASATSAVETKRARMAALRFNPAEEESLRVRREALAADIAAEVDRVDADAGAVAAATAFHYDAHALGAGWDASRVKGTVASLLSLRRADAATALEVAAGGKLYQVVVDSELTGKALLERGRLRRRVTLIPLNKVKRNTLHRDKVALAASISHGAAVPALDCIDFPEEVRPAMEYVFGSMFVCANAEVAKAITFNPRINAPSVTLDGDVFDPAGTLEGGSKPEVGGSPLLLRISNARNGQASLDAKRAALATVEQQLTAMSAAAKQYHALCADVDMAVHEAELLTTRLSKSEAGMAEQRAADAAAGVSQAEEQLAAVKAELVQASAAARSLEAAAANASKAREARIAALNAELKTAKISATRASDALSKQQQAASALRCDLEAAMKEVDSLQQRAADAGASVATTSAALANAHAAFARANAELERTAAALTAERNALAAADAAVKELRRQRDALSAEQEQAEGSIKRADGQLKTFEREAKAAERLQHELLGKHSWIEAERSFFGRPHSDFDFSANDPRACAAELTALEKRQAELDRKINKKVIGMVEQAERECADLLSKKRIIENDKSKIERVIAELDEKKNEALRTTWTKVNVDFGSIFSTLLPGVTAKLDPPEGGTVLDGLEVKVAFNGVWKESLTELSGGQRSLLALSLILALLLFKPAPMYILDEVDAALDLSHTQNIGRMIKTHFTKSQFIVVSLKQGMFGNANVIFRTLFVEGKGSTVTRTVPAPSAGAGSAAAATSEAPAARRGKATAHAGAAPAGDELLENSSARGGSAAAAAPKRRALPPAVDTPMAGAGAASSGRHEL